MWLKSISKEQFNLIVFSKSLRCNIVHGKLKYDIIDKEIEFAPWIKSI